MDVLHFRASNFPPEDFMLTQILLVFAFVFFCLGTFATPMNPPQPWYARFNLVSAGLAAWSLAELLGHLRG